MRRVFMISIALLLISCAIGRDYQRPDLEIPSRWRFGEKDAQLPVNAQWWEQFGDAVLNELIETALKENRDVGIAAARIEEYSGRYVAARGDLFPKMSAEGSGTRQRVTEEGLTAVPSGVPNPYPTYQAYFNASWEIDLWGKLRRSTEAARADLLSMEYAHHAVGLSLTASVARAYIDLLGYDRQLVIARETLRTRERSLEIFKMRFDAGVISELELNQVLSEYESARAMIPQIEKSIASQEHAINLLLGRNPGPVARGPGIDELKLPVVPAGLPSDLLERRPDILQAEQSLVAANARIGVAKAAFFPSISLTGMLGNASVDLTRLFTGPALIWNAGAALTLPVFTAGRTWGQVKASTALQKQALLNYQKAIQSAFREVEDSLADQNLTRVKLDAQYKQMTALRNYRDLALLRYENGYSSYLEVLDAQRNLFNMELNYIQTRGSLFHALINLYHAMGGGWVPEEKKPPLELSEEKKE